MPSPPGPLSRASAAPPPRAGEGERGYNLVMLMVIVTLLNVALAASLPLWSHVIQRDKEEELISRGFQYGEAIRVFQFRFQRPPIRLEELIEVKPRSIRRLWKDPMTEDGKWGIILVGQSPILTPQQPGEEQQEDPDGRRQEGNEEEEGSVFGPKKGEEVMVGPIRGVYSKSGKKSIILFNGRERYDEWHFTVDMIPGAQGMGGVPPPNGVPPPGGPQMAGGQFSLSTRWVGRPFPGFLQQPQIPDPGGIGGNPVGIDPGKLGPRRPPQKPSPQEPE